MDGALEGFELEALGDVVVVIGVKPGMGEIEVGTAPAVESGPRDAGPAGGFGGGNAELTGGEELGFAVLGGDGVGVDRRVIAGVCWSRFPCGSLCCACGP